MRFPNQGTAERFQQQVADLLQLPQASCNAAVRSALRAKGPDFVVWYDTRLRAIAGKKQQPCEPACNSDQVRGETGVQY